MQTESASRPSNPACAASRSRRRLSSRTLHYFNLRCLPYCHKERVRPAHQMGRRLWDKIVEEISREDPELRGLCDFLRRSGNGGLWDRLECAAAVSCRSLVLDWGREKNIRAVLGSLLQRFILSLDDLSSATFGPAPTVPRVQEVADGGNRARARAGCEHPAVLRARQRWARGRGGSVSREVLDIVYDGRCDFCARILSLCERLGSRGVPSSACTMPMTARACAHVSRCWPR
jgi:hypothetical protein